MKNCEKLTKQLQQSYNAMGHSISLGCALYNEEPLDVTIKVPLATLNRHGLIAGATGTGKTKTVQLLAENLSEQGVPVLLMDLKGDLSGLAANGDGNQAILDRHQKIGIRFNAQHYPVEFLTLSNEKGIKLRATVSEFGPLLFAKFLDLNDTQTSIISLVFKFCDDNHLPLLDLKDLKKILNFIMNDGKSGFKENYGQVSTQSISAILRKLIVLEQQGGNQFFGEPSFEVEDLLKKNNRKYGTISLLRLTDIQTHAKIFSTFMLCLLAEVYQKFPECGDTTKPKLVIFIDEAHLLFKNTSNTLIDQIESIVKLIRSKGVGIFFCTQSPNDIPEDILSQLGLKIQHALRAFTAKDRKSIKLVAQNYPMSEFYRVDELLTSLGIGEAAITVLNEQGQPTPLAATLLRAPQSRMGPLSHQELKDLIDHSALAKHYEQAIDRRSAYEMLAEKMEAIEQHTSTTHQTKTQPNGMTNSKNPLSSDSLLKSFGNTFIKEITRGLLGVLGIDGRRRR